MSFLRSALSGARVARGGAAVRAVFVGDLRALPFAAVCRRGRFAAFFAARAGLRAEVARFEGARLRADAAVRRGAADLRALRADFDFAGLRGARFALERVFRVAIFVPPSTSQARDERPRGAKDFGLRLNPRRTQSSSGVRGAA